MLSNKSTRALTPAVKAAGRSYTTVAQRARSVSTPRLPIVPARALSNTGPSTQQCRSRSSWHRPGCSWAASSTEGRVASRDKDCPACQQEEKDPFDLSPRDLMARHNHHLLEMKRMIDRDPYDAFFGASNRRVNALWDSHFSFPDVRSMFQSRAAVHSTTRVQASATSARQSPPKDDSDFRATVTWSHSGVDAKGKPFDKEGSLIYDPVTGRMVESKDDVDHVSSNAAPATVVGKVVHQSLVEDGTGSPDLKYARPSMDPEEAPVDKVTKAQQEKFRELRELEAQLEAAREAADTAVGIEKDAREAKFHDANAKDDIIPSGAPPRNINNEMGRMVNLDFDAHGPAHKYVSPTADHVHERPPPEVMRGDSKATMDDVMRREQELAAMKKTADSAVGVEEDAARANWANSDNASRPVSSQQDISPIFSHGLRSNPVSNARPLDSGKTSQRPTLATEESMSDKHRSTMDRIKAKEQEIEAAKRNLNTLKAKQHVMEHSWQREHGTDSFYSPDVRSTQRWPTPGELTQQARLREQKQDKAKQWASFKNASTSKRYLPVDEVAVQRQPEPAKKTSTTDDIPPSQWRSMSSRDEPTRGLMKDRTPGALSVFTKEKPLKSMSLSALNRDRADVMSSWTSKKDDSETRPKPAPADAMLDDEVASLKSAMNGFESKWQGGATRPHAPAPSPLPKSTPRTSETHASSPAPEPIAAEGDMAPNVAEFAGAERWYKNKAPHAASEAAQNDADAELVASLKGIYEDAYGPIFADADVNAGKGPQVESTKKPSVHASLENSVAPAEALGHAEPKAVQKPVTRPSSKSYKAIVFEQVGDDRLVRMPESKVRLLQMSKYLDREPHSQSDFDSYISRYPESQVVLRKHQRLGDQIVHATARYIVMRREVDHDEVVRLQLLHDMLDSQKSSNVNPIDGTTAMPKVAPAAGDFASPTGFVNHGVTDQEPPQPKPLRKVRKEEPVFSGAIPAQKYSVPEIVKMWNDQGMGGARRGAGPPHGPFGRGGRTHESHQRRKDRKFVRGMRKVLFVGGWFAAGCYATGVVIEYFRTGPSSTTDQAAPSWEDRGFGRVSTIGLFGGSTGSSTQGGSADANKGNETQKAETRSHISDLPMRGFEYPLLGILAGCVWYLVSNGQ